MKQRYNAQVNTINAGDGLNALDTTANSKLSGIQDGADKTSSNPQSYSWITGQKPDPDADNTQTILNAGAAIDNAKVNGLTLIEGGYIRADFLQITDAIIVSGGGVNWSSINDDGNKPADGAQVNTINAGDGLGALDTTANTKLNGIQSGAQVNTINAGDGLNALDSTANSKLGSVAWNADVTSSNTSANTTYVGSVPASTVQNWRYGSTTYINGGNIYTGTITANSIAANTITLDKLNAGYTGTVTFTGCTMNFANGADLVMQSTANSTSMIKFHQLSTGKMYDIKAGTYNSADYVGVSPLQNNTSFLIGDITGTYKYKYCDILAANAVNALAYTDSNNYSQINMLPYQLMIFTSQSGSQGSYFFRPSEFNGAGKNLGSSSYPWYSVYCHGIRSWSITPEYHNSYSVGDRTGNHFQAVFAQQFRAGNDDTVDSNVRILSKGASTTGTSRTFRGINSSGTVTADISDNGTFYSANSSYTGSSETLKKDIRDISDHAVVPILNLRGKLFQYINGDGKDTAGFISEEVAGLYPELVREFETKKDTKKMGINYTGFIPYLAKGIQEIQTYIDALAGRIEDLESAN